MDALNFILNCQPSTGGALCFEERTRRAEWPEQAGTAQALHRSVQARVTALLTFLCVEEKFLVALGASEAARFDAECSHASLNRGLANLGDRFFMQGGVADDAAFTYIFARQFKLGFY